MHDVYAYSLTVKQLILEVKAVNRETHHFYYRPNSPCRNDLTLTDSAFIKCHCRPIRR